MAKKLTYEYVKEYVENCGYMLLSDKNIEYKYNTYIKVKCSKGHIYDVNWNRFQSGDRCRKCEHDRRRLSYEYVYNCFKENGCELLSKEYINNRTPLEYICQCGTHDFITFDEFMRGRRCRNCKYDKKENNYKTKSFAEIKEYIESQGYILLSNEYINSKILLLIKCPNKHEPYLVTWNNFRRGRRCPKCAIEKRANARRLKFDEVKEFALGQGYLILSDTYKNNSTKLIFQCSKGHIFEMSYNKFKQGQRCTICQESKGESRSRQYFELLNINFEPQYIFKDCKNIEPLRYDFAVFYNVEKTKLAFLYEYDGEYHYLPIEGKKKLKYQQKLDNIKNQYCQQNNIPLLRIPYWNFDNIENILLQELNKHNIKI